MKFATLPRILRRRLQTSTSQSTKSLPLPRETHHFGASSNPPRLPTFLQPSRNLTNSCACHVFGNVSKSLRLPREKHFQPPKTPRDRQVLTILTSKSFSRAGVVQIWEAQLPKVLRTCSVVPFFRKNRSRAQMSTSKSAPGLPVFHDFDFQIALARRRGANFPKLNFQKCSEPTVF